MNAEDRFALLLGKTTMSAIVLETENEKLKRDNGELAASEAKLRARVAELESEKG
jgi:cell division protein FtsB